MGTEAWGVSARRGAAGPAQPVLQPARIHFVAARMQAQFQRVPCVAGPYLAFEPGAVDVQRSGGVVQWSVSRQMAKPRPISACRQCSSTTRPAIGTMVSAVPCTWRRFTGAVQAVGMRSQNPPENGRKAAKPSGAKQAMSHTIEAPWLNPPSTISRASTGQRRFTSASTPCRNRRSSRASLGEPWCDQVPFSPSGATSRNPSVPAGPVTSVSARTSAPSWV